MKYILNSLLAMLLVGAILAARDERYVLSLTMCLWMTQIAMIALFSRISKLEEQVRAHGMRISK